MPRWSQSRGRTGPLPFNAVSPQPPTFPSFILDSHHCPGCRPLRNTALSLTHSPTQLGPSCCQCPHPPNQSLSALPCEPVYWLILGHLFQCALCLCPFTGFALPSVSTQLKCKLLPSVPPMIRMGLWFFGTTEVKHFSSPHVRDAYCQRDLTPLMLTLITRLRQCVFGFSNVKLLSPSPFLYCTIWKEVFMQSHT